MGFVLKFGKHKDKDLSEVPDNYLMWLLENTEPKGKYADLNQKLITACHNELNARASGNGKVRDLPPPASGKHAHGANLPMESAIKEMKVFVERIYNDAKLGWDTLNDLEDKWVSKKDPI